MHRQKSLVFATLIVAISIMGCGSGSSVYVREDTVTKTMTYNDTDLKQLAEQMVSSLLRSDEVRSGAKPKIWVMDIKNATSEYIDGQGILDKISVALIKSGKVRLVDRSILEKIAHEKMRVDLSRIDVEDAVKLGKVAGADYVLTGNLMSIEQKDSGMFTDKKMVYYKFTMRLVGMDSEIAWMEEKELKKVN